MYMQVLYVKDDAGQSHGNVPSLTASPEARGAPASALHQSYGIAKSEQEMVSRHSDMTQPWWVQQLSKRLDTVRRAGILSGRRSRWGWDLQLQVGDWTMSSGVAFVASLAFPHPMGANVAEFGTSASSRS
jgi:hypothetical protein